MIGSHDGATGRGRFAFRPLARDDLPTLREWLGRPHVRAWWHHDPSPDQECAFIQSCQLHDEDEWWRALQVVGAPRDAFTVDYFIAEPSLIGRGLGTAMIGEFLADRWLRSPDATCSIVDVDPANPPSWRALEKNGYRAVWEGELDLRDPRDQGPCRIYRLERPDTAVVTSGQPLPPDARPPRKSAC